MTASSENSITLTIHEAHQRLSESVVRAERLAKRIELIGGESALALALTDTLASINEFIIHQRLAIASLEAIERDALSRYLEEALEEALQNSPAALEIHAEPKLANANAKPATVSMQTPNKRKSKKPDGTFRTAAGR